MQIKLLICLLLFYSYIWGMKTIIDIKTGKFFSLLGSPHFTENKNIAQRFDNNLEAEICIEMHIDSDDGFDLLGMVFTEVVDIN